MKNLKKVLALVLAFACAFTMFAGAVVYPDVPAGSEYSEAITMLSDLGIIQGKTDGKYHADESITRAEACALIARSVRWRVQLYRRCKGFLEGIRRWLLCSKRHHRWCWQQQVRAGSCDHRR